MLRLLINQPVLCVSQACSGSHIRGPESVCLSCIKWEIAIGQSVVPCGCARCQQRMTWPCLAVQILIAVIVTLWINWAHFMSWASVGGHEMMLAAQGLAGREHR